MLENVSEYITSYQRTSHYQQANATLVIRKANKSKWFVHVISNEKENDSCNYIEGCQDYQRNILIELAFERITSIYDEHITN